MAKIRVTKVKKKKPGVVKNTASDTYTAQELADNGIEIQDHDIDPPSDDESEQSDAGAETAPQKKIDGRGLVSKPYSIRSVKVPFSGIVAKNDEDNAFDANAFIEMLVTQVHLVTCRTSELVRLFIISEFQQHEEAELQKKDTSSFFVRIPDKGLCQYALTLVSNTEKAANNNSMLSAEQLRLKSKLKTFYTEQYKPLLEGVDLGFDLKNIKAICRIFEKTATQMAASYKTNIEMHYLTYLKKVIKMQYFGPATQKTVINADGSQVVETITLTKEQKKELGSKAYQMFCYLVHMNDLDMLYAADAYNEEEFQDDSITPLEDLSIYYSLVTKVTPDGPLMRDENGLDNLVYDIKVRPEDYLIYMLRITKILEDAGKSLNQACPLRTSEVPCHITIQRSFCAEAFEVDDYGVNENYVKGKNKRVTKVDLRKSQYTDLVWSFFIDLDHKIFKHMKKLTPSYEFYNSIQTDGVSCTLTFGHFKYEGDKRVKCKREKQTKTKAEKKKIAADKMVTNLKKDEKKFVLGKNLVGGDPGKANQLFLIDEDGRTLRYTSRQRDQESRAFVNHRVREKLRRLKPDADTRPTNLNQFADGKSVIEAEQVLNEHNTKTVYPDKFKEYIKVKAVVSAQVRWLYHKPAFRRMKLRRFIYGRKSVDKFAQRIIDTYGEDVAIGYGDWSRSTQMAGSPPTLGKGLRTRIEKKISTVITVQEAYTSQRCNRCAKEKKLDNLRDEKGYKVHRVLVCKECCNREGKGRVFNRHVNRDVNGARNILEVFRSELEGRGRPDHLKRPVKPAQ